MYLDDGVSRASAPDELPQYKPTHKGGALDSNDLFVDADEEAKGWYRGVEITHVLPRFQHEENHVAN